MWPLGPRIFWFWRGFGDRACPQRPVTEPKRSQKRKRPAERLQYFLNCSTEGLCPVRQTYQELVELVASPAERSSPPWGRTLLLLAPKIFQNRWRNWSADSAIPK